MLPEPSESLKQASVQRTTSQSPNPPQHGLHRSGSSTSHGLSSRQPGSAAATQLRTRSRTPTGAGGDASDSKEQDDNGVLKDDNDDNDNDIDDMTLEADVNAASSKSAGKLKKPPTGDSPIAKLPNGAS
jgi:hypothetical protein